MQKQKSAFVRILILALLFGGTAVQAKEVRLDYKGTVLNAELELAEGKTLADGVVLMTHGTLAHARMEIMRGLQAVFREYGVNTLAINLSLGMNDRQGMYECAETHRHKHTDALDEIGAWMGWLKQQSVGEVVLLGHSRGGNQTAWFASEHPGVDARAVVLIAPQVWDESYARKSYAKSYGTELLPILSGAKAHVAAGKGDTVLKQTDFIYCGDTSVTAAAFVSYYEPDPRMDTPYLVTKIDKPVLVFAGTEDTVVQGLEEKMQPLADSGKIELVVIDGADHMFRDLYAYDIVESVLDFLERH